MIVNRDAFTHQEQARVKQKLHGPDQGRGAVRSLRKTMPHAIGHGE